MALKSDVKFEEKLPSCLENDMRSLANFHQSTRKCQNWNFHGILCPKQKMHDRGVMGHDNDE